LPNEIGFIFPGQGAQYVGMGQELVEEFSEAQELFTKANDILGIDLKQICQKGPEEELNHTSNTQPAIFTVSMIIDNILKNSGIKPSIVAGHSLGEYSALASSNAFSFREGLQLVRKRGLLMDEALPAGLGSMAAIIKLDKNIIIEICEKVDGVCDVANYNSPSQIVISGEKDAIKEAVEMAKEKGALKAIELDVSGPFHSSLMEPAREKLSQEINKVKLTKPIVPIVANASAESTEDIDKIKENLLAQLTSSVRWVESMELMINQGINTFVEVGPGKVLKGLMRRINRSVDVYNVQDVKGLTKTLDKLGTSLTV
jgi:[acyl-carrier-protein] S-malonyltransferase